MLKNHYGGNFYDRTKEHHKSNRPDDGGSRATSKAIRQERIDSEKEEECSSRDFESLVGTYVFAAHRDGGHLFFAG